MKKKTIHYDKINYGFSLLKMLLVFEVILGHFCIWEEYDNILLWPFRELVSLSVPCFVILSFYLTERSFLQRDKIKYHIRLRRLLIPQIGWAFIYWIVYFLFTTFLKADLTHSISDLFWQLFTGHSPALNASMWYQIDMIIITIFFQFVFAGLNDKRGYSVIIGIMIFSYVLQFSGINRFLFGDMRFELKYPLGRIAEMIPYAVIGFSLRYFNVYDNLRKHRWIIMILCIILFYIGYNFPWHQVKDFGFSGLCKPYLALCIVSFANLCPLENLPLSIKKIILIISDYSLGIYCCHRMIYTIIHLSLPGLFISSIPMCVLTYLLSYLLCCLINLIPYSIFQSLVD